MSASYQIDRICDEFEAAWSGGQQPDIEQYLSRLAGEHRESLLNALILVDVEFRVRQQLSLDLAPYRRFGDFGVAAAERAIESIEAQTDSVNFSGEIESSLDAGECNPGSPAPKFSENDAPIDERPSSIGPYRILHQIGKGGMGVVFVAEQTHPVRRRVALKLIREGLNSDEVIARFEAERQALAMMDHPNIAKVLDAGTAPDGKPYFIMELVNGISITKYCDDGKLPLEERLQLFMQACRAIQHAHQNGVLHRDITANNVLVTQYDGVPCVKVIDFGLAKALQPTTLLTEKSMFTEFGRVMGTFQYMSPEQAELSTANVDARSDVYSLGVLLYELLTGSTPIERQRLKELALEGILSAIRTQETPPPSSRLSSLGKAAVVSEQRRSDVSSLNAALKGKLDWIVMKALEKNRNWRYETPMKLADDVACFLRGQPTVAQPPSAGIQICRFVRTHRYPVVAAAIAVVAVFLIFMLIRPAQTGLEAPRNGVETHSQPSPEVIPPMPHSGDLPDMHAASSLTVSPIKHFGDVWTVALSKDGTRLVSGDGGGVIRIWDLTKSSGDLQTKAPRMIECFEDHVWDVAFDADQQLIAAAGEKLVRIIDAATGFIVKELQFSGTCKSVDFSANGKYLAVAGESFLQLFDNETDQPLLTRSDVQEEVVFAPDSDSFWTCRSKPNLIWEVVEIACDTGLELQTYSAGREQVYSIAVSQNQSVTSAGFHGTIHLWRPNRPGPLGISAETAPAWSVAFSPNGKMLLTGDGRGTITVLSAETMQKLEVWKDGATWVRSISNCVRDNQLLVAYADGEGRINLRALPELGQ